MNVCFLRLYSCAAIACISLKFLTSHSDAAEPSAAAGPLFREAVKEFKAMTTTYYQHKTEVDQTSGSYLYDCVGFVSYALRQAAPKAWATAVEATGIEKGRIPSPPRYQTFFASLAEVPQPGWEAVTKVADLQPGDVVAWNRKTDTSVGHAVIIASTPARQADGTWSVEVYDSTSSPHSEDSRAEDERARLLPATGRRSGLGHGVMALVADPATGALTGFQWSLKAKAVSAPIAAARPQS